MQQHIYLDNSSTTRPCREAIDAIAISLEKNWGNPSSLHLMGIEAELEVEKARKTLADHLGCREDEIFFTGSGTEGNNTAITGALSALGRRGKRIVTTTIEHPSVLKVFERAEQQGFEVVRLSPDKSGKITAESIATAITKDTILVSMMLVNNETGLILPVEHIKKTITQVGSPALIHCDAVQAFGKMPVNPAKLGVDLLTASAHKIHGPKGIGLLYIKKGVHIDPLILGGGQERGIRSGTESTPLICGFGAAVKSLPPISLGLSAQRELWDFSKQCLLSTGFVNINSPDDCLPYILNISVAGYRSETLLHFLEAKNIYVSSGSACAKGGGSYVLKSLGINEQFADSALRISFSRYNTKEDIECLVTALKEAVVKIRKANR